MHQAVLDDFGAQGLIDWSQRPSGRKRGSLTGCNPVDCGKPGSKIHVLCDRQGIPLSVAVSAANTHDSQVLEPLVMATLAVRFRRGPRRRRPAKLPGVAQLPRWREHLMSANIKSA